MSLSIELDAPTFAPGEQLAGRVTVPAGRSGLTLVVEWFTSGKGDTDQEILHSIDLVSSDVPIVHTIDVRLPLLPLSYGGTLLKVEWRVVIYDPRKAVVAERSFGLAWAKAS